MSKPAGPGCELPEILEHAEPYGCVPCGHEWERPPEAEAAAGSPVLIRWRKL